MDFKKFFVACCSNINNDDLNFLAARSENPDFVSEQARIDMTILYYFSIYLAQLHRAHLWYSLTRTQFQICYVSLKNLSDTETLIPYFGQSEASKAMDAFKMVEL